MDFRHTTIPTRLPLSATHAQSFLNYSRTLCHTIVFMYVITEYSIISENSVRCFLFLSWLLLEMQCKTCVQIMTTRNNSSRLERYNPYRNTRTCVLRKFWILLAEIKTHFSHT
jgi:hypothetical protein